MEKALFSAEKMYTYIRGYATGLEMKQTICALTYAREKHKTQKRKNGEPYIVHPLTMACHALALGINDDVTVATILLHDVCEDCGVSPYELPVGEDVRRAVKLMTFCVEEGETKETAKDRYYAAMLSSRPASICKLIDRCHNVSSMAGTFLNSPENERSADKDRRSAGPRAPRVRGFQGIFLRIIQQTGLRGSRRTRRFRAGQ